MNFFGIDINYAHVIYTLVLLAFGFLVSYYKTNAKFKGYISTLINNAESMESDNPAKKEWVVNEIYSILPAWLKPVLNKTVLGMIVQSVFDSMKEYATKLMNKATDKLPVLPSATPTDSTAAASSAAPADATAASSAVK